jgi:hypothetical protein
MTEPESKTNGEFPRIENWGGREVKVIGSRVTKGGTVIYLVSEQNEPSQIIMKVPKSSEKDREEPDPTLRSEL